MTVSSTRQVNKLLVFTSLYPNSVQTRHGVFVEERLRSLLATHEVSAQVVAPVPWFPFKHRCFGRYAEFAAVPNREKRHGIDVLHPRYPVIPRVGMTLGPDAMAAAVMPTVRRLLAEGHDFDLIDAHYFYPDGVAAAKVARRVGKPFIVTARGADVNRIPDFKIPRRQIVAAARQAAAIVTVSNALREGLVDLGADRKKIMALRNGVDLVRFAPIDRKQARKRLKDIAGTIDRQVWLAVGHLIERKGIHITIPALARVPEAMLLVAGTGPEEDRLRRLAQQHGVSDRVRFLGHVEHDDLPAWFSAADVLVLPTGSEGMPNVVLEAMACGTPVVATAVGGIPELLTASAAGQLMAERTSEALDAAVSKLMADYPDRRATRAHAEQFGWDATTRGQLAIFENILSDNPQVRQSRQYKHYFRA